MSIGGWGGWQYAVGSSMLLQNAGGEHIAVYCVLDSDYHTDSQKRFRIKQAIQNSVHLHIWQRKEIENYLLVPTAIKRLIDSRLTQKTSSPTIEKIKKQFKLIFESLKDEAFDGISAEILSEDRSLGAGGANKQARKILESSWKTSEGQLSIVSGKAALSQLSKWSQEQFGVSLNPNAIVRYMRATEIAEEVKEVIKAIANGKPFP